MLGCFLYMMVLVFNEEKRYAIFSNVDQQIREKLQLAKLKQQNLPTSFIPTAAPTIVKISITPVPNKKILSPIGHEYQKMNNCGPASLAIAASYHQVNFTQFDAAAVVKGSDKDKNVRPDEMVAYLEDKGLGAIYRINGEVQIIEQLLANEIPVIAHQWLERPDGELVGHYRVITGFDQQKKVFYSSDSFNGEKFSMTYDEFENWWRPFNYGYIPVYKAKQEKIVQTILAEEWDEQINFERALARSQKQLRDNEDAYNYFNLGTNYLNVGEIVQAEQAYDKALSFEFPHYFLWYQFGPMEVYLRIGEYDKVVSTADDLLDNAGEVEEARLYKALVHLNKGNREEAKQEVKKALAANPRYQRAQNLLQELEE